MFLYLLPKVTQAEFQKDAAAKILPRFGLDHLVGELAGAAISEFRGANGIPGGLLIVPRPAWRMDSDVVVQTKSFDPPQVDPKVQVWREGQAGCWVGLHLDRVCGPTELLRTNYIGGVPVPDADGRKWLIPVARSTERMKSTLPVNYDFDVSGRAVPKPKGDYGELWEISGWIDDMLTGDEMDYPALATLLVPVLAINHRVSAVELSMLLNHADRAVFDDRSISVMAMVVTNSKLLEQANEAKKNAPADSVPSGTSSNDGGDSETKGEATVLAGLA